MPNGHDNEWKWARDSTKTSKERQQMPIDHIEITHDAPDDKVTCTVTLRGDAEKVIHALAHGLPREMLEQLRDALEVELRTVPRAGDLIDPRR